MSEAVAVANLDFEYELAGLPVSKFAPLLAKWRYLLRLLPGFEEADCLDPMGSLGYQGPVKRLAVWGVTRRTYRLARSLGHALPDPGVVQVVNDKRFSHGLEQELGIALPGSRIVDSLEQLQDLSHDWVLKHPFGVSGRERRVGRAGCFSDSDRGWARKRLQQGWTLVLEPWVEGRRDFSHHFEVSREGGVSYLGACELLTDSGGGFLGNRVGEEPFTEALDAGTEAVRRVAEQGYWGPVGVDGFLAPGLVRPLVEINARFTFGRMTLELGRRMPAGFTWHHRPTQTGDYPLPEPLRESGTSLTRLG